MISFFLIVKFLPASFSQMYQSSSLCFDMTTTLSATKMLKNLQKIDQSIKDQLIIQSFV
jgi:hypothetical protein